MNNNTFGKTMENLRKRISVRFVNIAGDCKLRKYEAKFLFTDTDSLFYKIKAGDVYEDFYEDKNLFDFTDYPQDLKFFDLVIKNIIKMKDEMKDEFKGNIIRELVGLKSEIYSLIVVDGK